MKKRIQYIEEVEVDIPDPTVMDLEVYKTLDNYINHMVNKAALDLGANCNSNIKIVE